MNAVAATTETARFLSWYEAEKAKGLLDVKFFPKNLDQATVESVFAEVNAIIKAESVKDEEVF